MFIIFRGMPSTAKKSFKESDENNDIAKKLLISHPSEMALVNIMLLAGLGLDLDALKKLFSIIMRLTLIPTALEVAVITVCSHYLLNFPWLWGILLG